MIKYKINTINIHHEMSKFIMERADLFTGHLEAFLDPVGYEHDPSNPLSIADAMADKSIVEDRRYQRDLRAFHKDLTDELIHAVMFEHFKSFPSGYDNRFYAMAKNAINHCQEADMDTWERVCRMASRTDIPHAVFTDRDEVIDEVPIGICNDDVRNVYHEMFVFIYGDLRKILPTNPWLTVDINIEGYTLDLTFGEDLRHVVFEKEHGSERWTGEYAYPTEKTD